MRGRKVDVVHSEARVRMSYWSGGDGEVSFEATDERSGIAVFEARFKPEDFVQLMSGQREVDVSATYYGDDRLGKFFHYRNRTIDVHEDDTGAGMGPTTQAIFDQIEAEGTAEGWQTSAAERPRLSKQWHVRQQIWTVSSEHPDSAMSASPGTEVQTSALNLPTKSKKKKSKKGPKK